MKRTNTFSSCRQWISVKTYLQASKLKFSFFLEIVSYNIVDRYIWFMFYIADKVTNIDCDDIEIYMVLLFEISLCESHCSTHTGFNIIRRKGFILSCRINYRKYLPTKRFQYDFFIGDSILKRTNIKLNNNLRNKCNK